MHLPRSEILFLMLCNMPALAGLHYMDLAGKIKKKQPIFEREKGRKVMSKYTRTLIWWNELKEFKLINIILLR